MLNNIAGVIAFQGLAAGDYEPIFTTTVGAGGSASITFSTIPSTYKHLQIRAIALSSSSNHGDLQLNGDTATNYAGHSLEGDGGSVAAQAGATRSDMFSMVRMAGSSGAVAASVIDILDYASTNKYKTVRALRGFDNNGTGNIGLISGSWRSTSAISSITINARAGSFAQYSHFALYGIKG